MASTSGGDLIERIYDAALSPQAWPALLAQISDSVGGSSAWLSRLDVRTGNGTGMTARIDPAMPDLYRRYYGGINPIAKVENAEGFMAAWRPLILTDEDRVPKEKMVKSEFYADFLKPQDIHSTLMIRLAARGSMTAVINIHRGARQGRFEGAEVEGLRVVHGHLIRAFEITERLEAAGSRVDDISAGLDLSPDAMFVLATDGRLRHANEPARSLLAARTRLRLGSGRLKAVGGDDDKALQALIGAAGSRMMRRGGSMGLGGAEAERPLMLTVAPIQADRLSVFHDGPSILVCAGAGAGRCATVEATLAAVLKLSPAEVRVAMALLDGRTPAESAQALSLSLHTVRAHLARMFAKTGTRRQAELVRVIMQAVCG